MKKSGNTFLCQGCGNVTSKWFGKCYSCGLLDSIVPSNPVSKSRDCVNLDIIKSTDDRPNEFIGGCKTGVEEIDTVFGGEIKFSSVTLIGGEPGIGKSTLMLHIAHLSGQESLYVSGEETVDQIISRAKRIGVASDKLFVIGNNSVSDVIHVVSMNKFIKLLIIDSIQTMYSDDLSHVGGINQIRMCANELISFVKKSNIILFIIGHITKDGQIAGPKLLEHMVDTVLYFEGENITQLRMLRTVKNRFGSVNEIGMFEMTSDGLKAVFNPSLLFLSANGDQNIGSTVYAAVEGSRSLLIEIQVLIIKTYMNIPRRSVVGWDVNRLAMIVAVLTSKCSLCFDNNEIYLNTAGGMKIHETAADLAVTASLISSLMHISILAKTVIFGEVALSGEVRKVSLTSLRLKEAIKLGFKTAILPKDNIEISGIELIYVNNVSELKEIICGNMSCKS